MQSGSFLDLNQAYLSFLLTNTSAGANSMQLDDSASCVINRIRVLNLQGGELERLESYGLLSNTIDHYTKDFTDINTQSAMEGGPGKFDYTPAQTTIAAAAANVNTLSGETITLSGGETLTVACIGGQGFLQNQSDILNQNIGRNYSIKLKGAWFNI